MRVDHARDDEADTFPWSPHRVVEAAAVDLPLNTDDWAAHLAHTEMQRREKRRAEDERSREIVQRQHRQRPKFPWNTHRDASPWIHTRRVEAEALLVVAALRQLAVDYDDRHLRFVVQCQIHRSREDHRLVQNRTWMNNKINPKIQSMLFW